MTTSVVEPVDPPWPAVIWGNVQDCVGSPWLLPDLEPAAADAETTDAPADLSLTE